MHRENVHHNNCLEDESMKTIYLVRHGRTLFNELNKVQGCSDSPLTEAGVRRAAELGAVFKREGITFDAAYTSDLGRARQTARLILSHSASPDVPLIETADLREISFGMFEGGSNDLMWQQVSEEIGNQVLTGDSADELKIKALSVLKRIDTTGLAENFENVQKRIHNILNIFAGSEERSILAVSHGLFISCLIYALSDRKIHVTTIPNTSVTKLVYDHGVFKITYISRTENL